MHCKINQIIIAGIVLLALGADFVKGNAVFLEHGFGDGSYKRISQLELPQAGSNSREQGSIDVSAYATALAADEKALLSAAQQGDRYYLRLVQQGSKGPGIIASIPAKCWAVAGPNARIVITTLSDGKPLALQMLAPCDASLQQSTVPTSAALPLITSIAIVQPETAPELLHGQPTEQQAAQFGAAFSQAASQAAPGAKAAPGGKAPPPPDERTWFQKNWIFLALAAFMMLNRAGAPPERGPTAGPRG